MATSGLCPTRPPLVLCLSAVIALAGIGAAIRPSLAAAADASGSERASHAQAGQVAEPYPWARRIASARGYARTRGGRVAFAVVDESGRLHGHRLRAPFLSASLVKAMLLVAYLDRPVVARRALDARDRRLLAPMITRSDNDAATVVRDIVGNRGLLRVGAAAGMRDFAPARSWGSSRVTAGDQARFFLRVDRLVPQRHRDYARRLLAGIVPRQRWGIPRASPPGWNVFFKGGWRHTVGWTVNQAALLEQIPRRLAVAVLSDGGRSYASGRETVRGVAARLLQGYR